MSPSAIEEAPKVALHFKEKALPEQQVNPDPSAQVDAVKGTDELPELLTGHHEPLKLSGALDHFEQFDVTPIIGREYANVDLAEWLRAPNSDELLRDLAITSKFNHVDIDTKSIPNTRDKNDALIQH